MTEKKHSWNDFIGNIWTDLFSATRLPKDSVVVEVAPGSVNKIGKGLAGYGFQGTLFLVEPDKKVCDFITRVYKNCMNGVNIIPVSKRLDAAIQELPENVDAIVANHPLDDIIVGKSLDAAAFEDYFDDHYTNGSAEQTRKYWDNLEKNPVLLEKIKSEVAEEWAGLIDKTNPRRVIVSQYESFFFKKHNIPSPDKHAYDVLKQIRGKYNSKPGPAVQTVLEKHSRDPDRWMVLKI